MKYLTLKHLAMSCSFLMAAFRFFVKLQLGLFVKDVVRCNGVQEYCGGRL